MKDWIKNLDRETMIRALIHGDIATNVTDGNWFIASLLRNGCKGYASYSDEALRALIEELYVVEDEDDAILEQRIRDIAANYDEE